MDAAIIRNWNAVVRPGDRVYHLGDFAFCSHTDAAHIVSHLAGEIHLIRGNHDYKRPSWWEEYFASVSDVKMIKVEGQKIFLSHYAMRTWESSHHGAWNLHGHSHGTLPRLPGYKQADMGVDCWGFRPVPFEEIKAQMDAIEFRPVDHHGDPEARMTSEASTVEPKAEPSPSSSPGNPGVTSPQGSGERNAA
jgi:calcineurin-like phosphoesterase family protein